MARITIKDVDDVATEQIETSDDITEGDWILVDQRAIDHESYAATVTEILGSHHARIDVNPTDDSDPGMAFDIPSDDYRKVTDSSELVSASRKIYE